MKQASTGMPRGTATIFLTTWLMFALSRVNLFPAYAQPVDGIPRRAAFAGLAWGTAHEICLQSPLEMDKIHRLSQGQQVMTLAKAALDNNFHAVLNTEDATYRRQTAATLAQGVVSSLPPQGVLCVGEEHDSPLHHAAELRLLQALREATPGTTPLALGMEMLVQCDAHRQALHDFSKGTASLSELHDQTNWENSWGYDIDYYADLLTYARDNEIQIVPLNCPLALSTFAKMFSTRSFLQGGRGKQTGFPVDVDFSSQLHREHFMASFFTANARASLPNEVLQKQYEAHTLREEFMAAGAAYHEKTVGGRIMVLSGRSHVEGRYGIPDRIHRRLGKHGFQAPTTMLLQGVDFPDRHRFIRNAISQKFADWLWLTDKSVV